MTRGTPSAARLPEDADMDNRIRALCKAAWRGLGTVKNYFVPDEVRYQRILLGICRGGYLPLNLRHSIKMVLGLYELEVARDFRSFSKPGGCLYDVGARHGYYTVAFSRLAGPARIYAFEPDAEHRAILDEVVARNRMNSEVQVLGLFLGRDVEEKENHETLDHLVFHKGLDAPDVIKIDVDGPEYEILNGSSRVLKECRPKLVVEVHSPQLETDCKALLEKSGYAVRIVKNNFWLQDLRPTELNRWLVAKPL